MCMCLCQWELLHSMDQSQFSSSVRDVVRLLPWDLKDIGYTLIINGKHCIYQCIIGFVNNIQVFVYEFCVQKCTNHIHCKEQLFVRDLFRKQYKFYNHKIKEETLSSISTDVTYLYMFQLDTNRLDTKPIEQNMVGHRTNWISRLIFEILRNIEVITL